MTLSRPSAVVAVIALAVATACTTSPSSEAATRTRVSSKVSQSHPMAHEQFTVRGSTSTHFKRKVALQVRRGSRWKTLKRTTTNTRGSYRFAKVTTTHSYKFSVVATSVRHAGHRYAAGRSTSFTERLAAQSAQLEVMPKVVQQGSAPAPSSAATSMVVARFSPARPGRKVVFKKLVGSGWQTVSSTAQHSDGSAYLPTSTPNLKGSDSYTATTLARSGAAALVSARSTSDLVTTTLGDEFTGSALNTSSDGWQYREGTAASRTKTTNDKATVSQSGNALHMVVLKPASGSKLYRTAQISFRRHMKPYGVAAARIKFERGRGQHGSFWLQSPTFGKVPGDAKASGSEIDVVEFFGQHYSGGGLANFLYYKDTSGESVKIGDVWSRASSLLAGKSDSWWTSYHVFSVNWTPSSYTFYVDGQVLFSTTRAVSGADEEIILSLLSSDWEFSKLDKSPDSLGSDKMDVDWMKVWQHS